MFRDNTPIPLHIKRMQTALDFPQGIFPELSDDDSFFASMDLGWQAVEPIIALVWSSIIASAYNGVNEL